MPSSEQAYSGLLIVNKPGRSLSHRAGNDPTAPFPRDENHTPMPTSHDIVQMVRRWSRQRRIGHTGTLDPMAGGVLVLCLGQATRLVEYYQGHAKTYLAVIRLGTATDSYDALGTRIAEAPVPLLDRQRLQTALDGFRGEIMQTPPVFSALKHKGESLHRKARRGEKVVLKPRPITIHELILVDWDGKSRINLRIRCSAGTYIRSLAHDLGMTLGTVAHLERLQREAAGAFTLADAHALTTIAAAATDGRLSDLILPPGTGLEMPRIGLNAEQIRLLGYGQKIAIERPTTEATAEVVLAQAYDEDGHFVGIIRHLMCQEANGGDGLWKAEKWFGRH